MSVGEAKPFTVKKPILKKSSLSSLNLTVEVGAEPDRTKNAIIGYEVTL